MSATDIMLIWQLAISMAGYTEWCNNNKTYCATPPAVYYTELGKSPVNERALGGIAPPDSKAIVLSPRLKAKNMLINHKGVMLHEFVHRLDMDSGRYKPRATCSLADMEKRAEDIQDVYLRKHGWVLSMPPEGRPSTILGEQCRKAKALGLIK